MQAHNQKVIFMYADKEKVNLNSKYSFIYYKLLKIE